jgi:hypothetical protein
MNLSVKCRYGLFTIFFLCALFPFPVSAKIPFKAGTPRADTDSTFKDWYYTPTGVYGRVYLSKISGRKYFKIHRSSPAQITIYKYNPSGKLTSSDQVYFQKGLIQLITETDHWGLTYDSILFQAESDHEFMVTEKLNGENPFYPCPYARHIYKNNLLTDVFMVADSSKLGYNKEGVAHYVYERYDDLKRFGEIRSVTYYGDIDNFVISRISGCHKMVFTYDNDDNQIRKMSYGLKDEPVSDRTGCFEAQSHFDKDGNLIQIDYYDIHGILNNELLGCQRMLMDYKKGYLVSQSISDGDYKPIKPTAGTEYVESINYAYDENGNQTERSFYDMDYHPMDNLKGIHKEINLFDKSDMKVETVYFKSNDKPASDEFGIHRYIYKRNEKGQLISKSFLDLMDQSIKDNIDGALLLKFRYDDWGRIASVSYWVNDSIKMQNNFGYHEKTNQYNEFGKISSIDFYDKSGKPFLNGRNYNRELVSHDELGNISERRFYNRDQPETIQESQTQIYKYHSIHYSYDYYGRVLTVEYFDIGEKPAEAIVPFSPSEIFHCHKVEFNYQENQLASQVFRTNNGQDKLVNCKNQLCLVSTGERLRLLQNSRLIPAGVEYRSSAKQPTEGNTFFDNQLSFRNRDSILLFLNEMRTGMTPQGCATYYRIAPINKYYQVNGDVKDHFVANDQTASILHFEKGVLQGSAEYFYPNGNLKEKGNYANGVRIGTWEYFYQNGIKAKSIRFENNQSFLVDCFMENGKQSVSNGEGKFESDIVAGTIEVPLHMKVIGTVHEGVQTGKWEAYFTKQSDPSNIEEFKQGKFIKGLSKPLIGAQLEYKDNYYCRFENIHPEEGTDHYGQGLYCNSRTSSQGRYTVIRSHFDSLHAGMESILKSSKYAEYSGWILIDIKYNENDSISEKSVKLYKENDEFKNAILNMLDKYMVVQPLSKNNKNPIAYERFYILLIEKNEMVIPEEILSQQREIQSAKSAFR